MGTRTFIISGFAGWLGGMATALIVSSCDTEPEADMSPSVVIEIYDQNGDAIPADLVWYGVSDPTPHPNTPTDMTAHRRAMCIDEACTRWAAGLDEPGQYLVQASVCGKLYGVECTVDKNGSTEFVTVTADGGGCNPLDKMKAPEQGNLCDMTARPSVHVMVVQQFDDYMRAVAADRVWYDYEGETYDAMCISSPTAESRSCYAWVAGYELEGEITVHATHCDREFKQTVTVGRTEDGCHVDTEYVVMTTHDLGCMRAKPAIPRPPPLPYVADPAM